MEEINFFSDGFLSNGEFHQLYSTIDIPDEIYLWDNRIEFDIQTRNWGTVNSNECDYSKITQETTNFYQSSAFNSGDSPIDQHQYLNDQTMDFPAIASEHFLTDMDEWKQNHSDDLFYQSNNNNDWELNLENLLFDTIDDSIIYNTELPARTFFCNDSCTSFLEETSEHLDISLQTFRPHCQDVRPAPDKKNDMKKYSVSPNEDKEFVCTYGDCRKVYAKAGHLKAHIRRHIGDKPYVCLWPNCTWKFSRSDELSRHRRSHSGIKPYKCDFCPKCFSRSDHLTKHRKVHERKMAAMKIKAVWTNLPPRKPGRKPKALTAQ